MYRVTISPSSAKTQSVDKNGGVGVAVLTQFRFGSCISIMLSMKHQDDHPSLREALPSHQLFREYLTSVDIVQHMGGCQTR